MSFGYFTASGKRRAGFTLRDGIVSTALSHDVIAHETTHALLDGLRSSAFIHPVGLTWTCRLHEAFSLVALFLHFTYADVVERAINEMAQRFFGRNVYPHRSGPWIWSCCRSKSGVPVALRSGVDLEGIAGTSYAVLPSKERGPKRYDPALRTPHALTARSWFPPYI